MKESKILGYMGKILYVNLTLRKVYEKKLTRDLMLNYVGGYGIGGRILYDEVPPWAGSFDPENRLIFATGPVTGTPAPSAGRYTVITKSPLTGYFGDANAGGFWGPELKFAGYDLIVVWGRSKKPVMIYINDGDVEILDAEPYWGMPIRETDHAIRKDLGDPKIKVAAIGPAGENLVRYAAILSDEAGRAAARCGVGAVMGYMRLKAVAVRGTKEVPAADPDRLKEIFKEVADHVRSNPSKSSFTKGGTPRIVEAVWELGDLPAYNWSWDALKDPKILNVRNLGWPGGYEKYLVRNRACYMCPIACRRVVRLDVDGKEMHVEGPEYETLGAMGTNCGIDDIGTIVKANELCNEFGIDTISVGSVIAFAMELYERGILTQKDTQGIKLNFGNAEALLELIPKIAYREGFGDILAEGVRRMARIIGGGAEKYAIEVKGLEIAMHDPRAFQGGGPHYACTPTGGRHTEGITLGVEQGMARPLLGIPKFEDRFSTKGKGVAAKIIEDWWHVLSAMGFCIFADVPWGYPSEALLLEAYTAATGVPLSVKEALRIGERIFNLKRAFNFRHGASRKDDRLPERLLKEPNRTGHTVKLEETLPEYYEARGWDMRTGKPKRETLIKLGLEDIADDLGV